jgi:hypothetical protein
MLMKLVPADWRWYIVRVTYELINPEIEQQRKFFNGVVVLYYAIQNSDIIVGEPDTETLKKYREEILDELLGYDYATVTKVLRKRPSTGDYTTTQEWSNLLTLCEETLFDDAGYLFPDSEEFWKLAKSLKSYDAARNVVMNRLQEYITKKGTI